MWMVFPAKRMLDRVALLWTEQDRSWPQLTVEMDGGAEAVGDASTERVPDWKFVTYKYPLLGSYAPSVGLYPNVKLPTKPFEVALITETTFDCMNPEPEGN